MADPVLELDAAASNVDGTNPGTSMLLVDTSTGWYLTGFEAPTPELKLLWTSNIDMDGSLRADPGQYENRTVTATLMVERSTAALCQAQLRILGHKIGKIAREGGTLKVTYPSGNTFIFDLLAGSHNITFDHAFVMGNLCTVTVSFTAMPGARGAEQDLGDNVETTLPYLVFTEASIPGDLPAFGRLVVDNDATFDQWWLVWGLESRYYSSSANAALYYEAEGRTALGSTTTAVGPSGSSGGGSNVMRNTSLFTDYFAIMSTQTTGGGAHLSHVGTFNVYARIQVSSGNSGDVSVALEWSEGDYLRSTMNTAITLAPIDGDGWRLIDLGLVTLRQVSSGTQQWEGQIVAKSTVAGDDIYVDYLLFVPVAEGSGIVSGVDRETTTTALSAYDNFTSTSTGSALNARSPVSGAAWATSGAATDFAFIDAGAATFNANEAVARSVSTTGFRFGVLGSAMTNMRVQAVVGTESIPPVNDGGVHGVMARYVDASNYLYLAVQSLSSEVGYAVLWGQGAGNMLDSKTFAPWPDQFELDLVVYSTGQTVGKIYSYSGGAVGDLIATLVASHAGLATGGAVASGKPGIIDYGNTTDAYERFWDDVRVSVPRRDAAVFASQSLELRHNRVQREDSAGALWTPASSYEGDYLEVPASGAESRTTRVVIKTTRSDPSERDAAFDDISARLFVTPRYLNVPSA